MTMDNERITKAQGKNEAYPTNVVPDNERYPSVMTIPGIKDKDLVIVIIKDHRIV